MEKQRWEESEKRMKREDQRRERVRRKKMQVREKVEQSRFTVFFSNALSYPLLSYADKAGSRFQDEPLGRYGTSGSFSDFPVPSASALPKGAGSGA